MKEIEIDGKKIEIASVVDARGLFCPMPVVRLKVELEKVKLDEVVELLADDPGVQEDLPSWCQETNNELLYLGKDGEDIFVAYVKKKSG